MEKTRNEHFKIVCSKEGICLEKSKSVKNAFRLSFITPAAPPLVCEGGLGSFYERLGRLNPDIIKNLVCNELNNKVYEVTLHFEAFAREFGMAPKTMTLYLEDRTSDEDGWRWSSPVIRTGPDRGFAPGPRAPRRWPASRA